MIRELQSESASLAVRDLALIPQGQELSTLDQFSDAAAEYIAGASNALEVAQEFVVDSEAAYQVADTLQDELKRRIKAWEDNRSPVTKPLNDLISLLVAKPGNDALKSAIAIYQSRASAYSRKIREEAEAEARRAEELARREREKLEAEARKREADALKLKTEAGREKALREAEELRQTAQMVPETFAVSAAVPVTTASNVAQVWRGEVVNVGQFLQWLILRPEWFMVLEFKQAELNRLAKQFTNTLAVPGTKFTQEDSFRSKGRRG